TAAQKPILRSAKATAPRETGLLVKSLSHKEKSYKKAAVSIIGARADVSGMVFRAFLRDNKRILGRARRAVPANYLHLVQGPTRPHQVNHQYHPGTEGNPFLIEAYKRNKRTTEHLMQQTLKEFVETEAKKLASGAG